MNDKALTAWRLTDGAVLYLGEERRWVNSLEEAKLLDDAGVEEALAWSRTPELERVVVDAYPIELGPDRTPKRRRAREIIRASGPTVRPDLARKEEVR